MGKSLNPIVERKALLNYNPNAIVRDYSQPVPYTTKKVGSILLLSFSIFILFTGFYIYIKIRWGI